MALRRFIEDTWRRVSIRHGFLEVDGPTFEYLDLYKVKSGDEIVSQLFHFQSREDKSGNTEAFALRPEFTPTLARMIAAKASALPRPIKWFSIPRCYRAERQQKGRLKEFFQWNADILGGETADVRRQFDLEIAAVCLDCLRELGLANTDVKLLWNDRTLVEQLFTLAGVPGERFGFAFYLLDRIAKLAAEQRKKLYEENGLTERERGFFEKLANKQDPLQAEFWQDVPPPPESTGGFEAYAKTIADTQEQIEKALGLMGLAGYATYDPSIVRGLAYYTGFVFEVAAAKGEHRAAAGGGRYDKLIEMFGGSPLPAVGFGMGDVVIANLLQELGKLPAEASRTVPDVFVVNALPTADEATKLMGELRASTWDATAKRVLPGHEGLNVATSYKTTKNVGKLMEEASKSGARFALLLAPAEHARGVVKFKNLQTREERELALGEVVASARLLLRG
jgi:histidyl-tRNA synthetase